MKRFIAMLAAVAFSFVSYQAVAASERASPPEAEAMVKKAVAYYKKNGREKTIVELMKKPGPFVDRDLYVTLYDMQANSLAHINPKMVGKNMMELRDADGVYHIKARMEAASKGDHGWQDFKFFNPVTKKIEPKKMYWERYDNLVFACGAYTAVN